MKAGSIWIQQYHGCSSSSKGKLALVLRATFVGFVLAQELLFVQGSLFCSS
jgi:hypothetical protein